MGCGSSTSLKVVDTSPIHPAGGATRQEVLVTHDACNQNHRHSNGSNNNGRVVIKNPKMPMETKNSDVEQNGSSPLETLENCRFDSKKKVEEDEEMSQKLNGGNDGEINPAAPGTSSSSTAGPPVDLPTCKTGPEQTEPSAALPGGESPVGAASGAEAAPSTGKSKTAKGKLPAMSQEEIMEAIETRVRALHAMDDESLCNDTGFQDIDFVCLQTFMGENPDIEFKKRVCDRLKDLDILRIFIRVHDCLFALEEPFANSDTYKSFKRIMTVIWNASDKSSNLCIEIAHSGIIKVILKDLTHKELEAQALKDDPGPQRTRLGLVSGELGIIHNTIQVNKALSQYIREAEGVAIIEGLLRCPLFKIKTKAAIILAYIINEKENEMINATDRHLKYIISILESALNGENHFSRKSGYHAREITAALNQLAGNEENKQRIVDLNALPFYVQLLQDDCTPEEQETAAKGIWILAFNEDTKQLIRQQDGCIEALQKLSDGRNERVRRAASGALWVIQDKSIVAHKTAPVHTDDVPHVMISYNWGSKPITLKIKNHLRKAGYKVWMDVDNMSGSTLEAMALAVEGAAVILVCMTQAYKDSPSCRTEAEYTYRLRKDVIPLRLQEKYLPDGWLGIMMGTKLWFDFSREENIDIHIPNLIREIGDRGKLSVVDPDLVVPKTVVSPQGVPPLSHASLAGGATSLSSRSWGTKDVQKWLKDNNLGQHDTKFAEMTGELLLEMKKMQVHAPEFFYKTLQTDLELGWMEILKFTKALDSVYS